MCNGQVSLYQPNILSAEWFGKVSMKKEKREEEERKIFEKMGGFIDEGKEGAA